MSQRTVSPEGKRNPGKHVASRGRRIARSVPVVLLCSVLLLIGSSIYLVRGAPPGFCPPTSRIWTCPLPEPGFPRPWEVGIGVSTYSTANTANGNLITAIPIIGWSGVGPDIEMVLYHNSANVNSDFDLTRGMARTRDNYLF